MCACPRLLAPPGFNMQRPRGASNRHGTDARLRRLAAQAAASVLSRTNEDIHPVGVPEVGPGRDKLPRPWLRAGFCVRLGDALVLHHPGMHVYPMARCKQNCKQSSEIFVRAMTVRATSFQDRFAGSPSVCPRPAEPDRGARRPRGELRRRRCRRPALREQAPAVAGRCCCCHLCNGGLDSVHFRADGNEHERRPCLRSGSRGTRPHWQEEKDARR